MDKATLEKIEEQLLAVRALHREKKISDDILYKSTVCLAYEFAMQEEWVRCTSLVQAVPLAYFQERQLQEMMADPRYSEVAYRLAFMMVQQGLVHLGPVLAVNMAPGRA